MAAGRDVLPPNIPGTTCRIIIGFGEVGFCTVGLIRVFVLILRFRATPFDVVMFCDTVPALCGAPPTLPERIKGFAGDGKRER